MNARELYIRAAEVVGTILECSPEDADERARQLCGNDEALLREVRELLSMNTVSASGDPLGDDVIEAQRRWNDDVIDAARKQKSEFRQAARAGQFTEAAIGPYRVLREIGRGGMGIVYECEQASPRRRVAVKVVDSLRNISVLEARLKAEAQIQGRLQHPGIAQIYDAGIAQIGTTSRPYIVMELIEGTPMQAYAGDPKRSARDQLELIAHIADAMANAHSRGVIHRDLKPDNVLVLPEGQPKILDFGIARLVDDVTIAMTTMTQDGQILGTLAYMAPEQLSGKSANVGPAADVYALGAMAYELIAGHPPIQLTDMSLSAAFRAIEIEEPIGIRRLNKSIDADIETIIGKCLCREPERRYANAGELADDIRRYLCNRPILARAPTRRYRAGKFVRRNKLLVAGVSATTLSLAAGLIGMSFFASGQHRARLIAQSEEIRARQKELDAIRGVLAGAAVLGKTGSPWEAAKQLYGIDPESRGWEWRHTALTLPWLIEIPNARKLLHNDADDTPSQFGQSLVNDRQLFRYSPETGTGELLDIFNGELTPLDLGEMRIERELISEVEVSDRIGLVLQDGSCGYFNVETGEFEAIQIRFNEPVRRVYVSKDSRTVVDWDSRDVNVYHDGIRIFSKETYTPVGQPYWSKPVFDPNGEWICMLPNTAIDSPICFNRETGEIISRGPAMIGLLNAAVSKDGKLLYVTSDDAGIRVFSMPEFQPVTNILPEYAFTRLVLVSPDGNLLLYNAYEQKELVLYDLAADQVIHRFPIGAPSFHGPPTFSPSGLLIAAHSPDNVYTWIIDRDHLEPSVVTHLEGQGSWIYQLAVSPDGTLLASAAPQGDIVLWDLLRDTEVARISRPTVSNSGNTAFYMNAPLFFMDNGNTLVFAEKDSASNRGGLSVLSLHTGERSWSEASTREELFDLAARMRGSEPGNLFHHAAVLPGNRIVQSEASTLFNFRLLTRRIGEPVSEADVIIDSYAEIWTGVSVHPDGEVYASGEYLMIRIRDARTDEVLYEIDEAASGGTYNLAYSPDGTRLAIGTKDGRVLLFETDYYKKVAEYEVEGMPEGATRNYVYNLAWTPDGKRLITCAQNSIRILESEHPRMRENRKREWERDLEEARTGIGTDSAERMLDIERWASPAIAHGKAASPEIE